LPKILPFRRPSPGSPPPDVVTWETYSLGDRRVQVQVQQWDDPAAAGIPADAEVYPWSHGRSVAIRLYDCATGRLIPPAASGLASPFLLGSPAPRA
jgi:hypothetical protein